MTSWPNANSAKHSTATSQAGALQAMLVKLLSRLRWLALGSRLLLVFTAFALLVWAAVGVDALWPMAWATRAAIRIVLPCVGLGLLCYAVWPRRKPARAAEHGAALIEQHRGLSQHPLSTALTLPHDSPEMDPLTSALRQRAQDHADTLVDPKDAVNTAPLARLSRPLGWLWLAVILWAVTTLLFPTLPGTGLGRLLLPAADIPPFSLTDIRVHWQPTTPTAGDDVVLTATAKGLPPDEVVMVFLNDEHRPIERRTLLALDDAQFITRLRSVRQPIIFHLETHGRRTKRYTITPDVPDTSQDTDASEPPKPDPSQVGDHGQETQPGSDQENPGDATSDAASQTAAALGDLADLINNLADLAGQAERSADGEGPTPRELAERLASLSQQADDLAQRLDEASGSASASAEFAESLDQLAQALRGMRSPGLLPGQGEPRASDQPGWGESLAQAAQQDAADLARGLGESHRDLASGLSNRRGGEDSQPFRDPAASGRYDETLEDGEQGVLPDALMQQVPPRYRDQTADYFRMLAEQQRPDTPIVDPPEESP